MGKVFTWPQVKARHVPGPNSFTVVLDRLRVVLAREPSVLGAGVCGSIVRGDSNRRSDIDCVVIFDANRRREAYEVMQGLSVFARDHHVPLTFIQSDTRLMSTRMHHFGPSFVEHMAFSMQGGGLIKGRPLEMLAPSVSRQAGVEEYLRFKMHYLQAHWAEYPAVGELDRVQFLQKSLEAPLHVARKTLSWYGPLSGDSKKYVLEQYRAQMPAKLGEALEKLVSTDRNYTAELETQLEHPHEADYLAMLGCIEEQVPDVLDFVTNNLLHIPTSAR
ncbi:MAG: nucleotidyltransferase domain-containing protein [Patescibacteria group bacterium]